MGMKPHIAGKWFDVECRFEERDIEYPVEGYTAIGEVNPKDTPQGVTHASGKRPLLCMILEPTRDLAEQTYKCMTKFNKYIENPTVRIWLFVGGGGLEKEQFK